MPYPSQILPAPGNKAIDCDIRDYFLIRHTDVADPTEILDSDTGFIRPNFICSPKEQIEDLSSSLLGIFEHQFIHIEFTEVGKEKYMSYCAPDHAVDVPMDEIDFNHNENRNFWTLQIGYMHGQEFKFTMSNEPYTSTCRVVHTPMRWNFWHFSFRWETNNLGPLAQLNPKDKLKVARRIATSTRHLICHYAKLIIPNHEILPQPCYRI